MDPLSITTSVITLLGAASNVYTFLQSIRHADRGLQSLTREVSSLNGYLRSIETALEDCRGNPYALAHIDPALWKESKIALSDCQETLEELSTVFSEPKRPSRSNTLFRRARVAAELRSRAGDIASFREKISMSNLSLQTLLQVINVSLSLRSNESHDNILRDLKELKDALKKSSQAATVSYSALFLNEQDTRLVHHLKGLIRAAQDFHTSASTTASTVAGSGETQPPPTDFGDDDARSGIQSRLPSVKIKQIETFLSETRRIARASTSASNERKDELVSPDPSEKSEVVPETREVAASSHSFSTIFTSGFSKIAQRALQQLNLHKAEGLLREALKWYGSSGLDDTRHQRRLHTQLALCNLLQGNRQEAQGLILRLIDSSMERDTVAHQLLYALALLQLHELDFEGARENSKRLWEALQKMPDCTVLVANDAMKLLATSYQESGDSLLADAIEAELPDLRLFEPVPKMVDFLVDCEELLITILGLEDRLEPLSPRSVISRINDLPIAKNPSPLQMRSVMEEVQSPTSSKGPFSDAGDDMLPKGYPVLADGRPKAKKKSWSNLRALFRSRLPWDIVTTDLYPSHNSAQDSSFKLRKRAKVSNVVQLSPREQPDSHCNIFPSSTIESSVEPESNSLACHCSEMRNDQESDSNSRTMEWIYGQTDNIPADAATESKDTLEPERRLKHQFSFEAGVIDNISDKDSRITTPTANEMPDNAVFELMDTSPRVRLPAWACDVTAGVGVATTTRSSLEAENDIYQLLGYGKPPPKLNTKPSSASIEVHDAAMEWSSSGSDSGISSNSGHVTRSTRQTSFDSSFMLDNEVDRENGVNDACRLPSSAVAAEPQRITECAPSDGASPEKSTESTRIYGQSLEPDKSLLQDGESSGEATNDMAQPRSPKSRSRSRREFGPAVVRLCRYRSPRKTAFRRRLPLSAATGLSKLFNGQAGEVNFDFGFSNALYSGPDAVVGPYTDLGEAELPKGQDACDFVAWGISTSSECQPDDSTSTKPESTDGKPLEPLDDNKLPQPPYRSGGIRTNRKRSWTRTQIDDFFEISHERPLFQASLVSV
ncbi:hypothetical protein F4802DRAFT_484036 [Xylaria palmicola]|nr:hypothetical protein F4802DRAFT_484036 [Xylaria palmicola]